MRIWVSTPVGDRHEWPHNFTFPPRVGDMVKSCGGELELQVVKVTHYEGAASSTYFNRYPYQIEQVVEVELGIPKVVSS